MTFAGYVLCGGASRRMGRDKALLTLDGQPLAVRVADALAAAGATEVVAIGGDEEGLRAAGLHHRPDRWPGEGPLGGIATALAAADGATAVVLSCDLVRPSPEAIRRVAEAVAGHDAAVPVIGGWHQWLHGAWAPSARPRLEQAFAAGERSVAGAAGALDVAAVADLEPGALRDADRPGDLPAAPRIPPVQVPAIDIATLRERLDEGAPLIDVREPDEYTEARAPGARLVPLGQLPDRMGEIPTDQTVYVICRSGGRSAKAVEHLRANGVDAVNVAGGTMAWIEAGHTVETGG